MRCVYQRILNTSRLNEISVREKVNDTLLLPGLIFEAERENTPNQFTDLTPW